MWCFYALSLVMFFYNLPELIFEYVNANMFSIWSDHSQNHMFAKGILPDTFKLAFVCLSLFPLSIYLCIKKLSIRCWTNLHPWLPSCCCCCCFLYLLFFRLFAPQLRSLLGLVPPPSSCNNASSHCFLLVPPLQHFNEGLIKHVRRWLLWLQNQQSGMMSFSFSH